MQSSYSFLAVSISAVIALSPLTAAKAQPIPDARSTTSDGDVSAISPAAPASSLDAASVPDTAVVNEPIRQNSNFSASGDEPAPDVRLAGANSGIEHAQAEPSPAQEPTSPPDQSAEPVLPQVPEISAPDAQVVPTTLPDVPTITDGELGEAAPEYLNPDPNPLLVPTLPEDVRLLGIQPITLQQALELARRNNRDLQVEQLQLQQARDSLREAQAANAPSAQLGTNLTGQENQQRQNLLGVPVEQDDILFTLGGSVELNYNLFTSGRRSASIRAAEARVQFQQLQVESIAEQLRLDVTNNYYDLQQADEQVRISQAALDEALQSLRDAQAQERAGVGTRFDVLQAQVDVANSQQELTQNLSDQRVARRQLVETLSIPEGIDIAAADPVAVAGDWNLSLEESIVLAYRNRADLEQQLLQREIGRQQRRAALGALGPQVSLFANYSVSNALNDDENDGFQDTYQFGAQLSLNLFDGGAARAQARQEEANIAIAETQFADSRNQIRFQVEEAFSTLQANFTNISTATLALEQATESLRLARLRFQAGVGTQTDVLRSQTELTRAEFNRLNAILGYNRSLAALQRAISNLPDGNLAEVP